jgi:signal transduction histidine kinase
MGWQATVLLTPTLFATVVALFLAGYAVVQLKEGQREPIVSLFFWITVVTIIWTGFSALKLLQTDPETKLLFFRLLHVGAAALPPLFFLFVVAYTDRIRWLQSELIGGVFLLPAVFVILLFIDSGQLLVSQTELLRNELVILRVSSGPGFFVFLLYSVALVVAALGLLLSETRRIGATYYPQAALITLALLLPIVFSLLTEAGVPPFTDERINLVPTSAAVSTAALGILLMRYRLFDLPPLAYATAMKYSPDSLLVLDQDGRIVHANDRSRDILDQLGVQLGDVLTHHLADFNPDTASGDLIEMTRKSSEPLYHRLLVEPLSRGGRHVGWVVVFRDESLQQRQQRQFQRQNERLEEFASVVSHDLRNPLHVAQGRLELVREECDSGNIEPIDRALTRMDTLIEDLLTLAHEGDRVGETEPIDVGELTENCWQNVETANATIHTPLDRLIYADRARLQQVFENLIRNAVEHGGNDVTVTVGELNDGFYVADDGPGISADDRDQIFDVGYSTSKEGTGLGLNIVKQVVDAHGWNIRVTDGSDDGTCFRITGVEFAE